MKEWVQNFRENASALKRKPRGRIPTVQTPENIDKVRMVAVKSQKRSVRRHYVATGLSDRRVQSILHKD
jgi:transposase